MYNILNIYVWVSQYLHEERKFRFYNKIENNQYHVNEVNYSTCFEQEKKFILCSDSCETISNMFSQYSDKKHDNIKYLESEICFTPTIKPILCN
jgi:hypothetical protein